MGEYNFLQKKKNKKGGPNNFMQLAKIRREAKILLEDLDIYQESNEAFAHWEKLKKNRTYICELCGKECITHLHHLNTSLRPKFVFYGFKNITFWMDEKSIPFGPQAIVDTYLAHYGIDNIIQTTKYYSVERDELMELCPSCHGKQHRKYPEYPEGWL
jgi:rubrerythrin